jgi:hypothetical protein
MVILEYRAIVEWKLARTYFRNMEKYLLQCHLMHHESHMKSLGIELWWAAGIPFPWVCYGQTWSHPINLKPTVMLFSHLLFLLSFYICTPSPVHISVCVCGRGGGGGRMLHSLPISFHLNNIQWGIQILEFLKIIRPRKILHLHAATHNNVQSYMNLQENGFRLCLYLMTLIFVQIT